MAGLPPGLEVPPGFEDVEPSPQPLGEASPAQDRGQQNGNQLEDAAEEDIKVGMASVQRGDGKGGDKKCTRLAVTMQKLHRSRVQSL